MDFQTSLNRIEELFRIMYLGLWVLWAETRWIAGPDIGYQRCLKAISSGLKKTGKPTAPGTSPRSAPGSGGCFKADGR